ncbi:poly-gamma-glutamate synthase PgsB [Halalkalibacter alkalisediminis]|uniref:Poly-gamma-glutamate synthase PgsB n=1 Tax=Halalkalibacter alkalisediminis TaxID=935616 RepID=A0ABV6NJU8_9BACI|nr:poly-gamma-glutamate synthase PgsB [Halalkalibacter alkalisediminis]
MVLLLIVLSILFVLILGITEKIRHQRNIDSIPIRVNINGIRGKSTVTRLITGVLKETKRKTIGKTTGTSARMIYWDTDEEKPIKRRLEGPNIGEQRNVVKEAADLGAEALVSECMAVNPDYQIVFQEQMLQANVGVIVNVLEDHMDVMGPTLDEVADAFTATIPHNGHLIVSESPYVDYYREVAKQRGTEVIVADNSRISEEFLRKFDYMIFPENASLALAVAEALGIDEETAFKGMLNAPIDPGAMRIAILGNPKYPSYFVNGFAANDASSTLKIWERLGELGYPTEKPVIIMNCRADRVDRTEQFAFDVLPHIEMEALVLIGETTRPIVDEYEAGNIPAKKIYNLENWSTDEIFTELQQFLSDTVIYGVGNIHGAAEPLIEKFEQEKEKTFIKDVG